jgi:hypothetical protein
MRLVERVVCFISPLIAGCAGPRFNVPESPPVKGDALLTPAPPSAVKHEQVDPVGALRSDVVEVPGASVPAAPRIAILPIRRGGPTFGDKEIRGVVDTLGQFVGPVGGVAGGPATDHGALLTGLVRAGLSQFGEQAEPVSRALSDRIASGLLRAGLTRQFGPDEIGAITAKKVATRDGQVTWQGSLDVLARVEPVSDADLLVAVRLDEAAPVTLTNSVTWAHEPKALEQYRVTHTRFRETARARREEIEGALERLRAACEAERRRYVEAGGELGKPGGPASSGDDGLAECERRLRRLETTSEQISALVAAAPTPDSLVEAASARAEKSAAPAFELAVNARLISARDLRILWLGGLSIRAASEREAVEAVADRVVEAIVRLQAAAPAPAPGPARPWGPP